MSETAKFSTEELEMELKRRSAMGGRGGPALADVSTTGAAEAGLEGQNRCTQPQISRPRSIHPFIENIFTHHPPQHEGTVRKYKKIREQAKELAQTMLENVQGTELDQSLMLLRLAVMMANAGIATSE
jgi:hypothetical protein